MKGKGVIQKLTLFFLFLVFGVFLGVAPQNVAHAQGDISRLVVTDLQVSPTEIQDGGKTTVKVNFAENENHNIQSGDIITVTWTRESNIQFSGYQKDLPLEVKGKNVGTVSIGADNATITFNDNVNNLDDVEGFASFEVQGRNFTQTSEEDTKTGNIISGDKKVTVSVKKPASGTVSVFYYKTGNMDTNDTEHVNWWLNANMGKVYVDQEIRIEDEIQNGHELVNDSFLITVTDYNNSSNDFSIKEFEQRYSGAKIDINQNKITVYIPQKWASLNLFSIYYKTKITAPKQNVFVNNSKAWYKENGKEAVAGKDFNYSVENINVDAGITGTVKGELKVLKRIEGTDIGIKGVQFKLKNDTGTVIKDGKSEFILETNEEGIANIKGLPVGKYKIKEINAPDWVDFDPFSAQELNFEVKENDTEGTVLNVNNKVKTMDISVEKKWVGKETDSVTVHLYADEKDTGKSATLNAGNGWSYTFANVRQYTAEGKEIKYTIKEDVPSGYKDKITGSQKEGYIITNTNTEKITIPVTKTWIGKAGNSVTVKLFADKKDTGKTVTLNENSQWKDAFRDLPKYDEKDGHEIKYTIEEVKMDGYNSVVSGTAETGFTITNTITGKVTIPVTKTWVGKEGASATIHLYADGKEVDSTNLNAGNHWQYTFSNLEKYRYGKEIQYTVKEDGIENYKSEITGDMASGFMVKNTNIEKREIPVTKQWNGKATDAVTIKLLADGSEKETATLKESDGWKHTFKNLPKYDDKDGHEIVYSIKEIKIDGYNTGITGTADTGFTITNTIKGKVSVPVTKTWVGKGGTSAAIHLYADDKEVDSVTLSKDNNWQHTFTNLEKYKDGKEIRYTIKEDGTPNYKSVITGDMASGFTVKNINTEKASVPVTKQWVGNPTDKVEVKLFADNAEKETVTLTADTGWKHTFKDLPKYDENDGHEIVYTISEVRADGYTTGISGTAKEGFTITNTIIGKVSIPVTKKWIGRATDNITVNLYADGKKVDSQKLSKDNHWQYTFKDLDQNKDGREIIYTVKEKKIDGYATTVTGDAKNGFVITNTKDTSTTSNATTPKTGDNSNLPIYGGMLMASLGAIFLLIGRREQA
jgi:LPXTG-motif cell wall-anchored protein